MKSKRMKFVLLALMAGVMTLTGVSFAEAGVKLDDLQILLRWRDDRRPSEPPAPAPMERREAREPYYGPQPGGPAPQPAPGPRGHGPKQVHAPHDPHAPRHSFHGEPQRPGNPGRDVPPPTHRPPHR